MIAFGSVIYSGALCYLDELIKSINSQTCEEFDVLLINDDVDINVVRSYTEKIKEHKVIIVDEVQSHKTPAQLRVDLLSEAKIRGYELLVMGDCDDTFSVERIKRIEEQYQKADGYAFYYNDLVLADGSFAIKGMPEKTESIDIILQHNYLGLSNNSINLKRLSLEWIYSLNDCDSFVFDWYLFSRLLLINESGSYVENAYTVYRVHENNFAGINQRKKDMLSKELAVKKKHYQILEKYSEKIKAMYEAIKDMTIEDIHQNEDVSSFWWSNFKI